MSRYNYQIVEETQFEILLQNTTLEHAIDVLYTDQDIRDNYNGGNSLINYINGTDQVIWINQYCSIGQSSSILRVGDMCKYIIDQFSNPNIKDVQIEFSDMIHMNINSYIQPGNDRFKMLGFMFRPSKGCFVRYKKPKPKPVSVTKLVMNGLRNRTVAIIQHMVNIDRKFEIQFKDSSSIEAQKDVVRFGRKNGIKLSTILNYVPKEGESGYYSYGRVQTDFWSAVFERIKVNYKHKLTEAEMEQMLKMAKDDYYDWYNSIK